MNKFFEVFNTLKVPEEIGVYLTAAIGINGDIVKVIVFLVPYF